MISLEAARHTVMLIVESAQLLVELLSIAIIAFGVGTAVISYLREARSGRSANFRPTRLALAHQLVVALEFQLAADIIATAVAPSWDQIGKLAAIATIRTVLNHVLVREMREEEHEESVQEEPTRRPDA